MGDAASGSYQAARRQCCCLGFPGGRGGYPGASPTASGSYPRARWVSRRQYLGVTLLLATLCSTGYVVLYYRATITSHSIMLFNKMQFYNSDSTTGPDSNRSYSSFSMSHGLVLNTKWNSSELKSTEVLHSAVENRSAIPLLTLFSSWADRPELEQVRNLTMENWARLMPAVVPVLFTNSSKLAGYAEAHGWQVMPVSRAAVGVPILKNMYLDIFAHFNSPLYAFANGDILFSKSLVDTLLAILASAHLPLDSHPLLVVGQRVNVAMVYPYEVETFEGVARIAKTRGKLFTTMAEDFFITDRTYPWHSIPGVVIGRTAYDNWLVLNSIRRHDVVIDATNTLLAVHQTTKAGNYEGFTHANSTYNNNLLTRLYKKIQYMAGCVDCAPWKTRKDSRGKIVVEFVTRKPKHC